MLLSARCCQWVSFAWIAVILVAVMAFHQNKTAGAARLAVAHGVSRVRYMVGSFAAETIMLQGWYMVLYFLLSVVTGALSQPGRTAFFWMQSAWILQASYAVVWLVCRLCSSELAGATFCFVVTLAGVIVSVSAPDPAAVSPLSALLFYATPMPYWLALGGGIRFLGRLLVMAQVLPPCAWRQRWLSRQ